MAASLTPPSFNGITGIPIYRLSALPAAYALDLASLCPSGETKSTLCIDCIYLPAIKSH